MPTARSDRGLTLDNALDEALDEALNRARRRERLSHAEWRKRRAEVARLIAAGEEAAARSLLAGVSDAPTASNSSGATRTAVAPTKETKSPVVAEPARAKKPVASKSKSVAPSKAETPRGSRQAVKRPSRQRPVSKPHPVAKRRQRREVQPAGWVPWLERQPPWALSLATHGAVFVALSLLTFATFGDSTLLLTASVAEDDAWSDMPAEVTLTEFESDASDPVAEPIDVVVEDLATMETASLVEPVDLTPITDFGDLAISADALMAAVPAAGAGDGESEASESGGAAAAGGSSGKVSFFGAESEAGCVAFVVDNSGTMQQGRMETTLLELDAAVRRLTTSQRFYVVFYSDQAYPMFFPDSTTEPLPATRDNADRLTEWLRTVEICLGGRLLDAVELAASVEPDVVYVLSDGDIRSTRIMGRLTTPEAWPFVIHTLGMGARTPEHAANLQAIAAASGGTFRPVAAHPAAIQAARLRPIRYHREPGPVWGSRVQVWK